MSGHKRRQKFKHYELDSKLSDTKCAKKPVEEVLAVTSLSKNSVLLKVLGTKVHALVDTGASVSCVSMAFLRKTGIDLKSMETSSVRYIVGVSSNQVEVLGKIDVSLVIAGAQFVYRFLVLDNLKHSLILGVDFLFDHKCFIDVGLGKLYIQEGLVGASLSVAGCARDSRAMYVPPKGQTDIPISFPRSYAKQILLLEPLPLEQHDIQIARCVIKGKRRRKRCHGIIRVLNPTDEEVFVKPKTAVASVTRVEREDVLNLDENDIPEHGPEINLLNTSGSSNVSEGNEEIPFNISNSNLTEEQQSELNAFLRRNADVFSTS